MESHVATGGAIVLVGFMGAGKSTGARSLAAELGGQAVDSDRELEQRIGEPIESFFDREGVPVIALGGGAVQSERVRDALTRHTVVHLEIEPGDAWRRASGKGRPLARDPERFETLWRDRRGLYESVSDVVMPPSERDALRRALPFVRALAGAPPGTRLVWAAAESGAYPVFVGRGLIAAGFFPPLRGRRFVVTDENVARVQRVEGDDRIVVVAGEEHKTIHGVEHVLRSLAQGGAERGDLVVAAGYAEVVKTALIAGGSLWARVRQGGQIGVPEIMGCLRTKLSVVAQDERDGGRRQVLNLGHTVGHAIEAATGYQRYRHGEAVGVGLLAALRLSDREALRAEVAELLGARGLPLRFAGASVDDVLALVERDKKRSEGRVPFVLVEAPGEVTPGHDVDPAALRAAVEELHEA